MDKNATSFGQRATLYQNSRPHYPSALFEWIAQQAPDRTLAWDAGTGTGQAAHGLTAHFEQVIGTDIDLGQIAQTEEGAGLAFQTAPAEASPLQDQSASVITVATALHWFDHTAFWEEVSRVSKKGALFCAWTYHWAETEADVDTLLIQPLRKVVEPYWSDGNRLCWKGYDAQELHMPFEQIEMPPFACKLMWTPAQIAAFCQSWSAYKRACDAGLEAELAGIIEKALKTLGDGPRRYEMPLHSIAARLA